MITNKYWGPNPAVLARAEELARKWKSCAAAKERVGGPVVLELGPGAIPFSEATHFAGRPGGPTDVRAAAGDRRPFYDVDLSRDPLPFPAGSVDFLYARHVLEDLADPIHLLQEINRVARHGYLETPSPAAELTRGVDGGGERPWRGYHHHRSICWIDFDELHLVAKYPIVEHLEMLPWYDEDLADPIQWNTHTFFSAPMKWKLHEHDVDFKVYDGSYERLLEKAAAMQIARNDALAVKIATLTPAVPEVVVDKQYADPAVDDDIPF